MKNLYESFQIDEEVKSKTDMIFPIKLIISECEAGNNLKFGKMNDADFIA